MSAALAAPPVELVHTVRAACAIARLALPLVPADEPRPRRAVETAEAWAREPSDERARAALDAAVDTSDRAAAIGLAASAAARAAGLPTAVVRAGRSRDALGPVLVCVAEAWAYAVRRSGWTERGVRDALDAELHICVSALLDAHRHPRPTPLGAFLRAPSRDGAHVALDWLREGHGTASPPVWALAWLYAHVPGVSP